MKSKYTVSWDENTNWREATTRVFADNYWKAMKVDIATLEFMGDWEFFNWDDSMNVIELVWAFECKRYPDGLIKKFKTRFSVRGDQKLEGIDFFEFSSF